MVHLRSNTRCSGKNISSGRTLFPKHPLFHILTTNTYKVSICRMKKSKNLEIRDHDISNIFQGNFTNLVCNKISNVYTEMIILMAHRFNVSCTLMTEMYI